jgi:Ca-activated chloride channel family protein
VLKPLQAAEIAKARGVTIYTVGAGKDGSAPYPIFDEMGNKMGYRRILADLDEPALREIAHATGGEYFRADNTDTIQSAFAAIDRSQRTRFEFKTRRARDFFPWFLSVGGILIVWGSLLARPPLQQETLA